MILRLLLPTMLLFATCPFACLGQGTTEPDLRTLSAASLIEGPVAPEMVVLSRGARLAAVTLKGDPADPPALLGGVSVKVLDSQGRDGYARIFSVSPKEVSWLAPEWLADGPATVTIRDEGGRETVGRIDVARVSPGLFSVGGTGLGFALTAATRRGEDGSEQPLKTYQCGTLPSACVALHLDLGSGEVLLTLYATGVRYAEKVEVRIGGEPAEVLSVRSQATALGVDEIQVRVPAALAGRSDVEVTLTAASATSNGLLVAIGPPAHTVTEARPASLAIGETADLTLAGSSLQDAADVRFYPAAGITVSGVKAAADAVSASVSVAPAASPGEILAVAASSRGRSDPLAITLRAPRPRIRSLAPSSAVVGSTIVQIRVEGENLSGVTALRFEPPEGIAVSNLTAAAALVTAKVVVAETAATGTRSVTVDSPGGASESLPFAVTPRPAPAITSLSPSSAGQGETIAALRIAGTNLAGVDRIVFSPPDGITVSGLSAGDTAVTAQVAVSRDAAAGDREVTVLAGSLRSNTLKFQISSAQPKLTGISIPRGSPGQTIALRLTGQGLAGATAIAATPPEGITGTVRSATDSVVEATLAIRPDSPLGVRQIQLQVNRIWTYGIQFTVFTGANPPQITAARIDVASAKPTELSVNIAVDFTDEDGDISTNAFDESKGAALEIFDKVTCSYTRDGRSYTQTSARQAFRWDELNQPGVTAGRIALSYLLDQFNTLISAPTRIEVTLIDSTGRRSNMVPVTVPKWTCGYR